MMGQAFYDAIGSYIKPFGGMVGSTDGGQHNVGSPHYDGRALDIPMGASASDAAKANADRMVADLRNRGFTVRDERTRPQGQEVWGGPHLHVESIQQGQNAATPQPFGRRSIKTDEVKERYRTLSSDEVQQLGLPAGTVAQQGPTGQIQIVNKPRDLPAGGQVIENDDGSTTFIPAGKVAEGERNAAGFFGRMERANNILEQFERDGYDPTNATDRAAQSVSDRGGLTGAFARGRVSTTGQQYNQAAMDWVRAKLRKESGAAIGKDEARMEYENYFPVYGDTPEVIEQKRQARVEANRAMRQSAGGALPPAAKPASGGSQKRRLKFNPQTGKLE